MRNDILCISSSIDPVLGECPNCGNGFHLVETGTEFQGADTAFCGICGIQLISFLDARESIESIDKVA